MFPGTSQKPPPWSSQDLPALLGKKPLPSLEWLFIADQFCRLLTLQEANSQLVADRGLQPGLLPSGHSSIHCPSVHPLSIPRPSFLPFIYPSIHSSSQRPTTHPSTLLSIHSIYPFTIVSIHTQPASQPANPQTLFRTDWVLGPCTAAGKTETKRQDGVYVCRRLHDPLRN